MANGQLNGISEDVFLQRTGSWFRIGDELGRPVGPCDGESGDQDSSQTHREDLPVSTLQTTQPPPGMPRRDGVVHRLLDAPPHTSTLPDVPRRQNLG